MNDTIDPSVQDENQRLPIPKRHDPRSLAIMPKSFEELQHYARQVLASKMCPEHYKTVEQVAIAMAHGLEIGLKPLQSLQYICVINNRPVVWGDGGVAIVEGSGLLEYRDESWDPKTREAKCTVKRRDRPRPVTQSFSVQDAQSAVLMGKDTYKRYPQRMCMWRARTWALRDAFPDVLAGLTFMDELIETTPGISLVETDPGVFTVEEPAPIRNPFEDDIDDIEEMPDETLPLGHRLSVALETASTPDEVKAIGMAFGSELEECADDERQGYRQLYAAHLKRVRGEIHEDEVLEFSRSFRSETESEE